MRVGFFSDSYFPSIDGVTYTLKSWRDKLEERGHEVYIVYPGSMGYTPEEREIPVFSIPNPFYSGYNIPLPPGFGKFPEVDIVHCHSPAPLGIAGRLYARRNDLPAVYTHHTPLEQYFEQEIHSKLLADALARLYLPLENYFLKSFETVTASTPDIGRDVDPVELPVGVDTEFFQPTENSIIEDSGLERPVIGYSGRISMEKNIDELIEFAEDFEGSVFIVGEGPQKEKIKRLSPQNVLMKDFLPRERLPEFYTGIDVFVTASTADTLGLSVLEANACGTPVVAPNVEPFTHTVADGNGLRYTKGDIRDLGGKVENALSGDFEPREAVMKFSLSKTIDQLEGIYGDIGDGV